LPAHLGLFFDIPTIGCGKSRLCGTYVEPASAAGNFEELTDNGESIGVVLRTKNNVKPLFISVGNKFPLKMQSTDHALLPRLRLQSQSGLLIRPRE